MSPSVARRSYFCFVFWPVPNPGQVIMHRRKLFTQNENSLCTSSLMLFVLLLCSFRCSSYCYLHYVIHIIAMFIIMFIFYEHHSLQCCKMTLFNFRGDKTAKLFFPFSTHQSYAITRSMSWNNCLILNRFLTLNNSSHKTDSCDLII